ncbi:MAG: BspA family leucine-rich repeat surface protein, partial [Bacteroidales bacterium]|nr:BspA family leucine-rich repeat surface protein [Bacteroidales bacterium]
MNKPIIFTLLLTILFLMPTLGAKAQTNEPYIVLKDGTATFYYNSSKPIGALPIQSQRDDANWPADTRNSVTKVVFDASFKDYEPTSCAYWFYKFINLTEISGIKENLNTANVTAMRSMFSHCSSLTTLDVSNFNTANVTDMRYMFDYCSSLTTLDVSNFNTENVTNMDGMFYKCSSLTTLDVSNFNTANVADMSSMFLECSSLTTLDVSNFNTANVTDMDYMFFKCKGLNAIFVGDNWSTASVTKSSGMFEDCTNLCGGKGTGYNADITDATYAKIDGGKDAPGYFTKSGEPAFKIVIVSIAITTAPKTEYTEGEDFSAADGILSLVYNTGFKESIDLSKATITGYDKNKVGEQTLKIAYEGFETELKVTVKANQPTPVSSVADSPSIKVWSFNSTIYIETLPDSQYKIIDLQGRT